MAQIEGVDRNQQFMFPPTLDEWVAKDHPARVVEMFVESLDTKELGFSEKNRKTGRPNYSPKAMLKILLYGYATGERSSRILERKTHDDIAYRWLSRDLHPDYRSIARFRQNNTEAMNKLLQATLEMYVEAGCEISGVVFTDGTKLYANASDNNMASDKRIKRLEELAKKILDEAEKRDQDEDEEQGRNNDQFLRKGSLEKIKAKIIKMKEPQKANDKQTVSMTDKDAKFMRHSMGKGIHVSYNAQITADKNGIVVAADVTEKAADDGELLKASIEQTEKNTGKKVKTIVADAGYYETETLRQLSKKYKCLVPKGKNAAKGETRFEYNRKTKRYECEKGSELVRITSKVVNGNRYLVYAAKSGDCNSCELCGKCYKGKGTKKYGRRIMIYEHHKFVEKYLMKFKKNKKLYDKRKTIIEPTIGTIKVRQRFRGFLLRGLQKVKAEWVLATTGHNLLKIWKIKLANQQ